MKRIIKLLLFLPILIICFLLNLQDSYGQKPETLDYPAAMTPLDWKFSLGMSSIAMPTDIVLETSSIRWPLFRFVAQMGLPSNFVLNARISTEIVTNHFQLGGKWIYEFSDKLHANVEYSLAYFFGQLKITGYDTDVHGWISYPSLGIGYDFGELTLTAIGTISFVNSLTSTSGGVETSFNANRFNGFFYRISLEQLFFKNTTIGLAFQMNYLRFYYPEWPLFPSFDRYYWIPELQVWLTL